MLNGKKFGKWVRSYRRDNGLSLHRLSAITGVAVSRLSALENGEIPNPTLKYFTAFAKSLGYSSLSLFFAELEEMK